MQIPIGAVEYGFKQPYWYCVKKSRDQAMWMAMDGESAERWELLRRLYEEYGRVLGAAAVRSFDEVERALRRGGYLDRVVKAAWPLVSPDRVVRSLLTSRAALADAADALREIGAIHEARREAQEAAIEKARRQRRRSSRPAL